MVITIAVAANTIQHASAGRFVSRCSKKKNDPAATASRSANDHGGIRFPAITIPAVAAADTTSRISAGARLPGRARTVARRSMGSKGNETKYRMCCAGARAMPRGVCGDVHRSFDSQSGRS
ncbi:MAG: hypothetical protein E6G46_10050 [Actinobacteria bacterium]|nr:MAG: hypothetical protein E6G46_10050 [Actinomycetota bacterium]